MDIRKFMDEKYYTSGRGRAFKMVQNINGGLRGFDDPIYYQESIVDSKHNMQAIAIFINENPEDPVHQLRKEYLSNKFVKALNEACSDLGLLQYVDTDVVDITSHRRITFDKPDYSDLDDDLRETLESINESRDEVREWNEQYVEETRREIDEYNRQEYGDEYADRELEKIKAHEKAKEEDPFIDCLNPDETHIRVDKYSFITRGLSA